MVKINFTYLRASQPVRNQKVNPTIEPTVEKKIHELVLARGEWSPSLDDTDTQRTGSFELDGNDNNHFHAFHPLTFSILESHNENESRDHSSAPTIQINNLSKRISTESAVEYDDNGRPLLIYVAPNDKWSVSTLGASIRDFFGRGKSIRDDRQFVPHHENLMSGSF
mmetsp:Transcript_7064/g.8174  ORF Transcript_7064/g.8174 Transcript_7064/m.8174 type:complete len:167 (-) Transcript_7064:211-711(-)|eukprot:CAMPEP_0204628822 /NCGR_PEP_ID=MMETSP0717-20131115/16674_1 /ASSEMBLY_ACC=CAM_ASM_000666 /TAXON_ID=230516 /ORGANISM="Chaetoceros curvisetus" /LENGTH=166 /DNA_ID=CAMNT_0051645569 /DNA_START=23 /DNA_END=523 /DNA_ORIENTATION=+